MPLINWLRILLGVLIAAVLVATVIWIAQPYWAAKANHKAAEAVTTAVTAEIPKEAAEAAKANDAATTKNESHATSVKAAAARIPAAANPAAAYTMFYDLVCREQFYVADPQCSQRNGVGRKNSGPH